MEDSSNSSSSGEESSQSDESLNTDSNPSMRISQFGIDYDERAHLDYQLNSCRSNFTGISNNEETKDTYSRDSMFSIKSQDMKSYFDSPANSKKALPSKR